jgi:hypothetical protein
VILTVHEGIYNNKVNHAPLSEFQLRDFDVEVNSSCHKHGGTQKMVIQDVASSVKLPLKIILSVLYKLKLLDFIIIPSLLSKLSQFCESIFIVLDPFHKSFPIITIEDCINDTF